MARAKVAEDTLGQTEEAYKALSKPRQMLLSAVQELYEGLQIALIVRRMQSSQSENGQHSTAWNTDNARGFEPRENSADGLDCYAEEVGNVDTSHWGRKTDRGVFSASAG